MFFRVVIVGSIILNQAAIQIGLIRIPIPAGAARIRAEKAFLEQFPENISHDGSRVGMDDGLCSALNIRLSANPATFAMI